MAWFGGKVSLGNFPDLAGAVNKLSESVKNIEKNFDTALGLEEENSENAASTSDGSLWAFMGQSGESTDEISEEPEQAKSSSSDVDKENLNSNKSPKSIAGLQKEEKQDAIVQTPDDETEIVTGDKSDSSAPAIDRSLADLSALPVELSTANDVQIKGDDSSAPPDTKSFDEPLQENVDDSSGKFVTEEPPSSTSPLNPVPSDASLVPPPAGSGGVQESFNDLDKGVLNDVPEVQAHESSSENLVLKEERSVLDAVTTSEVLYAEECSGRISTDIPQIQEVAESVPNSASPEDVITSVVGTPEKTGDTDTSEQELKLTFNTSPLANADSATDLEMMKKEMRMMESALQGAARQAQAKADELANMMNENEQLKAVIEDLQRKSIEADESLREEHHQKVAALERKVYVLTRERDTLRREQSKKSDAASLLKEKDEIITQVMAEGEQLSKKQAAQESHIRKLRAQIRELEEEKKGLLTKLEVEDNKVESIKKDKAATEKLLQETFEKHQVELVTQKEYYTNALNAAKEAEALAEACANTEARTELESRLREVEERETMLVQALEELRQTLSRKEQQAVYREEMLQRDIEDLQKRYQASERRCEELITQVPDSTRPLLRQIEAMQETTSRKAEAWAAVERSLNSRLQEAEARADAAEEKGQSINERLSQTLSRINVLEAQISCLRAEQTQLTRSLEKERQKAAENRQEYLALKEDADTNEGRVKQFEEEIKELRRKHKHEIQEATINLELLQQELEKEKAARIQSSVVSDQSSIEKHKSSDKGYLNRRLSSPSSLSSMEESYFLQASLDSSSHPSGHRNGVEGTLSPHYIKSMPPSAFEAALRQKDGELASYTSRLASLEAIRDSLAEELVKMTAQCEKLQSEVAMVPGLRAELEALRRRHSAALELMGERDEELEELRADIVDLKEMYREQVNMLVNKIQRMNSSMLIA